MFNLYLTLAALAYAMLVCYTVTMRKAKQQQEADLSDILDETLTLPFRVLRYFLSKEHSGKRSIGGLYENLCGPRVVTIANIKRKCFGNKP